jgi:hypothetical protein
LRTSKPVSRAITAQGSPSWRRRAAYRHTFSRDATPQLARGRFGDQGSNLVAGCHRKVLRR